MAKYRGGRINEEVRRALAEIFRELKDPRVPEMTSIVRVEVTPDLKYAKVAVSVLGDGDAVKEAVKGLSDARGFIRRELAGRLAVRQAPELNFVADDSIAYGAHIAKLLKDMNNQD